MKKIILSIIILSSSLTSFSQNQQEIEAIELEGKKMYRSEMASWYGTDLFLEKYGDKREKIGGYLSYPAGDYTTCIFYSKGDSPLVIGTISFDSTLSITTASVIGVQRELTPIEKDLWTIRSLAYKEMVSDTIFKMYKNSNLNLIPMIDGDDRRVYILTGSSQNGTVIIGNDYLLRFDKKNNLKVKKKLHHSVQFFEYGENKGEISAHTHLPETGDYITATDICTLLLYQNATHWKWHFVTSNEFVSLWNCEQKSLLVLTRKAYEKIYGDQ